MVRSRRMLQNRLSCNLMTFRRLDLANRRVPPFVCYSSWLYAQAM